MSPRRADPELADRRREALVRAGYAEILERGIQAVTIDSVVARANSSKGGALYYFPTKDDLLYGVLKWLLAQVSRSLDEVAHSADTPRARLERRRRLHRDRHVPERRLRRIEPGRLRGIRPMSRGGHVRYLDRPVQRPGRGERNDLQRRRPLHDGRCLLGWRVRRRAASRLRRRRRLHGRQLQPGDGLRPHEQHGTVQRRRRVHHGRYL